MFQNDLSGLYRNCIPVAGNTWGQLGYLANTVPYAVPNQFGLGLNQIPCTMGQQAFGGQVPYTLGQNIGNFGYLGLPVTHNWSNFNTGFNTGIPFSGAFNQATMPVNVFGYYGHNPFVAGQWTTPQSLLCR